MSAPHTRHISVVVSLAYGRQQTYETHRKNDASRTCIGASTHLPPLLWRRITPQALAHQTSIWGLPGGVDSHHKGGGEQQSDGSRTGQDKSQPFTTALWAAQGGTAHWLTPHTAIRQSQPRLLTALTVMSPRHPTHLHRPGSHSLCQHTCHFDL